MPERDDPTPNPPRVFLQLGEVTHELQLREGETIFAAALRAGIDPPFSCLGGYCCSCRATLEAGEVEMKHNKALSERQLGRGWILTCQAVPTTAECRVRVPDPGEW